MRVEGWERQLTEYLVAAAQRTPEWGAHDCALWAAGWVKVCTGRDHVTDWVGTYSTETGAARAMRRRGYQSVADIATAHLEEKPVMLAQRGDLVLHPLTDSLGICNGRVSQFVGGTGAIVIDTLACTRAWAV